MRNEIFLEFAENPDLGEVFARKAVGDKCCLVIHFQVNQLSGEGMHGTIEKIVKSEDYDQSPADKDKGEISPTRDTPVMVNIMGKMHRENSASSAKNHPASRKPAASSSPYPMGRR